MPGGEGEYGYFLELHNSLFVIQLQKSDLREIHQPSYFSVESFDFCIFGFTSLTKPNFWLSPVTVAVKSCATFSTKTNHVF